MPEDNKPFLTLSPPRDYATPAGPQRNIQKPMLPSRERQAVRLGNKIQAVQENFSDRALVISESAPVSSEEQVLVIETIGAVSELSRAVRLIPELEWLIEDSKDEIPDEDFFFNGKDEKLLDKRLYLVATNAGVLREIVRLWNMYIENVRFPKGWTPWRNLFSQLKDVRFWDVQDRIEQDVKDYWGDQLLEPGDRIKFEIELWYKVDDAKAQTIEIECRQLVTALHGQILSSTRLKEIRYHALLVDLPVEIISEVLEGRIPLLMTNPAVMFFKPSAQGMSVGGVLQALEENLEKPAVGGEPIVAVLDGLPVENHRLLADRIVVDDPDERGVTYAVDARLHGTSMVSLILHGDLEENGPTLNSKIYVHPVLKPQENGPESTPDDILLLDIVHRAVKRMFEGEGDTPATAPSVKIINLSVGDRLRKFYGHMSPWARLVDWLSYKYGVLFFISAGNVHEKLDCNLTHGELEQTSNEELSVIISKQLVASIDQRRLLSPAEAINAVTVGASYIDNSDWTPVPGRRLLFSSTAPSPYSRCGLGYRKAVKPDILMPGGRVIYQDSIGGNNAAASLKPLTDFISRSPGLKCAVPNGYAFIKGTSGATALASRRAALLVQDLEQLRPQLPELAQSGVEAAVVKSLMVHCASWGDMKEMIGDAVRDMYPGMHWSHQRNKISSMLGYGMINPERAEGCADHRVTLLRGGEITPGVTHEFKMPLPPTINGRREWRKLCITLAWLAPTECNLQAYRSTKLSFQPRGDVLGVERVESESNVVKRGTVQHEVLEGDRALAFTDGDSLVIELVCVGDASDQAHRIPYGIAVSLEVEQGVGVLLYQEVEQRIRPGVRV